MLNTLAFTEFAKLAKNYHYIAIHKTFKSNGITPTNAYQKLKPEYDNIVLLDIKNKTQPRLSHIYFNSLVDIETFDQAVHILENDGEESSLFSKNPFDILKHYHQAYQCPKLLDSYVGGLLGFVNHNAVKLIEPKLSMTDTANEVPDLLFHIYGNAILFDYESDAITLIHLAHITNDLQADYANALDILDKYYQQLLTKQLPSYRKQMTTTKTELNVDISNERFAELVKQAKKYIADGDIFQVVLSRNFSLPFTEEPSELYQTLSTTNPSPYSFYYTNQDYVVIGTSPEKLISIDNGMIESKPLAGTRPNEPVNKMAAELLSDPKDNAEHMMLVDLARNDLGKICEVGSVQVTQLKSIEKFSKVMHLSSTVTGKLKQDCDPFTALQATFPAGTVSGAPKLRAIEIIDSLEPTKRGFYGGLFCAIDCNGNLKTCLTIRTVVIQDGVATIRAGAGIVIDSDPMLEAAETRHKAEAVINALQQVTGGAK